MSNTAATTLLVIDDEPQVLESLSAYFEDHDYAVYRALDGDEGLEVFRRDTPDIVLTDLRMPRTDGLDVIAAVTRESPDTPVVVVSGTGVLGDAIEAVRIGAWDYVTKPIPDMAVLRHVTDKALERARLIRENRRYQEHLEEQITARTAQLETANAALTREIEQRGRMERERCSLESQLRHAQKMEAVGQLAGGVAHDFNNILTTILGNAELSIRALGTDFPSDGPPLEGLRQIERGAQRASALTRQLLTFSRRQISRPEVLDLSRTVAEMENMLRRLLTEDIRLTVRLRSQQPTIRADAGQIEQVVMNLVVNAGDAMPQGGLLTLETSDEVLGEANTATHAEARPGRHVVLTVTDSGVGMSAETIERIFEPFFTTKPVGQGTGLGLATAYGIVKQVGGHITVRSRPQQGTAFKVYFPGVEAAPSHPSPHQEDKQQCWVGSETVLVCEDDALVRELELQILESAGYTVLAARDGEEALRTAAAHRGAIDLLVTDVVLPDIHGKQVADTLTAAEPSLETLFVSGYSYSVMRGHGVLDEGVELLEKPFNRESLLKRIRTLLDRRRPSADTSAESVANEMRSAASSARQPG